jgi:hypothetical protein
VRGEQRGFDSCSPAAFLIPPPPLSLTCSAFFIPQAVVGDTFFSAASPVPPLPGFAPAKPMVFASLYPVDTGA